MQKDRLRAVVGSVAIVGLAARGSYAGVVEDVAFGLGYAGFTIEGSHNVLSDGFDLSVSRDFVGNPLNFGPVDLTLRGPVAFELSTGRRVLPELDATLTMELTGNPLFGVPGYELDADVGGQSTQINGTLVVEAAMSLNAFGYYDLGLTYSSRQDVQTSGRVADDEKSFDFDVGPLNLSGNVYADVLAVLTDPFFDQAGAVNIFTSFSGPGSLAALLTDADGATQARLAAGADAAVEYRSALLAGKPVRLQGPANLPDPALNRPQPQLGDFPDQAAVPEPTVLLLMLLGLPAVLRRRPRRPARV